MKKLILLLVLLSIVICSDLEAKAQTEVEGAKTEAKESKETKEAGKVKETEKKIRKITYDNMSQEEKNTALIEASENGDLAKVKELVENGADVNTKDNKFGEIPLMLASREGHAEVVKLLIKKGAVNLQNRYGYTALMLASWQGNTEVAKLLVEAGVDTNIKDEYGITALMLASGDSAKMSIRETVSDHTGILRGTYGGNFKIAKSLVEAGADIHAKDKEGNTSLIHASEYGHAEIVTLLIVSGADINAKNNKGNTALMKGSYNTEIVKYLIDSGADSSGMSVKDWVSTGILEKVKKSITNGADVNLKDEDDDYNGDTALHRASSLGYTEIAKILIDSDADVNLKNKHGSTALHAAAEQGHLEIVKLLIASGADIYIEDRSGYTAMGAASREYGFPEEYDSGGEDIADTIRRRKKVAKYLKTKETGKVKKSANILEAAKNGDLKSVQKFIADGVDVDTTMRGNEGILGVTPLMYASREGHIEIVKYLLANGADVHASKTYGDQAAVDWASEYGHTEIRELLIKHGATAYSIVTAANIGNFAEVHNLIREGADVNAEHPNGNTALTEAAFALFLYSEEYSGVYVEIMKLLIEEGADINHQTPRGYTALMHASRDGDFEMVRYLVEKGASMNLGTSNANKGGSGITALMMALERGHTEIANYLESVQ